MSGVGRPDVSAAFRELGRMLRTEQPWPMTLRRVTELVRQTLPTVEAASITVVTDEWGPYTQAFTGSVAIDLDERQYDAGFGPCLDAARNTQTIAVDHSDPLRPYATFSDVAVAAGVSHTLSVGLPLDGQLVAGLNVYLSGEIDESLREYAAAFAGYAAAAASGDGLHCK